MQIKLFEMEPIRIKRPTRYTIDTKEAYENIAQDIADWSEDADEDLDEIVSELKDLFSVEDFFNNNGYELCRTMENDYLYSPNLELVEIMDDASRHITFALNDAIKKWVVDCWIKPKFEVGHKMKMVYEKEECDAEIIRVDADFARYLVNVPSRMKDTSGVYKNFEDVEPDFFKKSEE